MILRKIFCVLILNILFCFNYASAQQSFVYSGDSVILKLNFYNYGNIIWQQSIDGINWNDIPGAITNNAVIKPTTTFYYRAKITYGSCNPFYSDVSKIEVKNFSCGDTLIDYRDNYKYPTVELGSQCWLAKNLNVGIMVNNPQVYPSNNGIIEKYCYLNDSANCELYGGLYFWDELMNYTQTESTRGICPNGWHVPSDDEWKVLELHLGMDPNVVNSGNTWRGTDQGTQLQAGGSSGYNALMCGLGIPAGMFNAIGSMEYVYTSTASESAPSNAWRRCLDVNLNNVGRWDTYPKNYALSLRCVKD